jgi:hypothetical protein
MESGRDYFFSAVLDEFAALEFAAVEEVEAEFVLPPDAVLPFVAVFEFVSPVIDPAGRAPLNSLGLSTTFFAK